MGIRGLGLYLEVGDKVHKHQCGKCGIVWEHSDSCAGSDEAHTCPKCGYLTFMKYHGPEVVSKWVRDKYMFYTY